MTAPSDQPMPYANAAMLYRAAGWVAPIPVEGKSLPPTGWTGKTGGWPNGADVQAWCDFDGHKNIGLRLPHTVIGIDVDNYDGKNGAANLAAHIEMWGPLPDTWRSTSRTDEISGIRLYRIPDNPTVQWQSLIEGGGIELVRWDHRYAMCWPSVHPSGRVYRWTRDNLVTINIPRPEELPFLPAAWIIGLVKGPALHDTKADITSGAAFVRSLIGADSPPCSVMTNAVNLAIRTVMAAGSRHDVMRDVQLDIIRLGESGHPGVISGLDRLGESFVGLVTDRDNAAKVREEYVRALDGGAAIVAGARTWPPPKQDPCTIGVAGTAPGPLPSAVAAPAIGAAPANDSTDDGQAAPVSTWVEPLDIKAALDGRLPTRPPTELAREDGTMLLYPGKVNGLLGPSESGKTWIVLLAAAQAMALGRTVVMMDFEDTVVGLVERLRALGVADDVIQNQVVYLAPSEPLTALIQADLVTFLVTTEPSLIILDGVNAAMTTMGLDLNSNTDATNFHINLLLPMSRTGAAVVVVDHTPKNDHEGLSKGGIGAQAKRAAMTGAAIKVEVVKQFSRGHAGLLKLIVDKDRGGHVRMATTNGVIGMAHLEPGEDGTLSVRIEAEEPSIDDDGEFRPTTLMGKVADYLTDNPGATQNAVYKNVEGKQSYLKTALSALVKEGYVGATQGARNSSLHSMIRLWPTTVSDRVPPWPPTGPNVTVSPPVRSTVGRDTVDVDQDTLGDGHGHQDHFDFENEDPADE